MLGKINHVNMSQKKARIPVLIPGKVGFRAKNILGIKTVNSSRRLNNSIYASGSSFKIH